MAPSIVSHCRPRLIGTRAFALDRAPWRRDTASARNVAAFVILGDRTLRDLAATRPSSTERLRAVSGIGQVRLREHGVELLQVIDTHCAARVVMRARPLTSLCGGPIFNSFHTTCFQY